MEILVTLLVITVISLLMQKSASKPAIPDQIVVEKKVCPPHKWDWQEIVDQNGVKHDARLICKVCAQTPGSL